MINENNKKVPCGGFYLGDGLIMDGNTLKSLGGEQVQSDYTQNDPTAKDYIKNRPGGYKEGWEITWDGDTTGKTVVKMNDTVSFVLVSDTILSKEDVIGGTINTGSDRTFTIISDMIYSVNESSFEISEMVFVIGNITDTKFPSTGIYFMSSPLVVTTLYRTIYYRFDDKYIPDTILRENKAYTNDERNVSITWDGNTDGKDTFLFNGSGYYKMSDDVPVFKRIQSLSTTSNGSSELSELYEGENCYRAGFSIVVTKAGACRLAANEGSAMKQFTAPSAGIYFWTNNTDRYQTSLELTSFIEQDGIIVNSANKKWKIAVDDNGAISATEIPE